MLHTNEKLPRATRPRRGKHRKKTAFRVIPLLLFVLTLTFLSIPAAVQPSSASRVDSGMRQQYLALVSSQRQPLKKLEALSTAPKSGKPVRFEMDYKPLPTPTPTPAPTPTPTPPAPSGGGSSTFTAGAPVKVFHGPRGRGRVAITFDDGYHSSAITKILDVLGAKNVHTTFFPTGQALGQNHALWQRAVAEGHEIGNHTMTHPRLDKLDAAGIRSELQGMENQLQKALGGSAPALRFMRPPYGCGGFKESETILSVSGQMNYSGVIMWSVDPNDCKIKTAPARLQHILERVKDGDIILLHTIDMDAEILSSLIDQLRAKGLEPGGIDWLFS